MGTYELLREIAGSWAMLALLIFFLGVVVWAYRPGSRKMHEDIANIPFRHDDRPAAPRDQGPAKEA